jgi:two-component system, LytTR family, sensor histidine kinase AlgZ
VHPVLVRGSRLVIYTGIWIAVGVGLAAILARLGAVPWGAGFLLAVPLWVVYGFVCLATWYLCQWVPLRGQTAVRALWVYPVAALISAALWLNLWVMAFRITALDAGMAATVTRSLPLVFALAVLLFVLSGALNYLVIAIDESRASETRALRLQMLAAEAELRALRSQITPHFLFNSLNSISALTSSDPAGARRMCVMLGDFLRGTLRMGRTERIPLAQELALVDQFLAIEQVRFGSRLHVARAIDDRALGATVPPLILQPLAENALRHGLADLVDGGTVSLEAGLDGNHLRLVVENPMDVDGRPRRGSEGGFGLENVKRRLEAAYGNKAILESMARNGRFRVEVRLPFEADAALAKERA